ncbi:hypothetical protein [Cohnella cellulosilytica]|uniref:Uncharacterized protein n=1 Tax=Cohnella cellulosilytica TaxID=986710 RepID=A0ABW2FBX7_9BACL
MDQQEQQILTCLKLKFEHQDLCQTNQQNVWIMVATVVPFTTKQIEIALTVEEVPTHTVRLVLRTTDEVGTNDYVDGTDVFIRVDNQNKIAELVWEDLWAEGPPIFHGGTIPDALRWVRELAEPFYVELKDPFLTTEQRSALNVHNEDYIIEPAHEPRKEKRETRLLTDEDFDGLF